MTCLLPAACTVLTCESDVVTVSAADVYANGAGWWQHDGGAFDASETQIHAAGDGADGDPIFGYNGDGVNGDGLVTSLDTLMVLVRYTTMKINIIEQRNRKTCGQKTIDAARITLLRAGVIAVLLAGAAWAVDDGGGAGCVGAQIVEAAVDAAIDGNSIEVWGGSYV